MAIRTESRPRTDHPAASKQGAVTGQASAEQQVLVISRVTT